MLEWDASPHGPTRPLAKLEGIHEDAIVAVIVRHIQATRNTHTANHTQRPLVSHACTPAAHQCYWHCHASRPRPKVRDDGRRVLTCSLDRTARLWELMTPADVKAAKTAAGASAGGPLSHVGDRSFTAAAAPMSNTNWVPGRAQSDSLGRGLCSPRPAANAWQQRRHRPWQRSLLLVRQGSPKAC
jgi:hypothetical protein